MAMTPERNKKRSEFGNLVEDRKLKIQVGARFQKFTPTWTAIDLYDKSPIIDHNWDLHDLPIEDNSVDCFVCNAVLEHVPYPMLALSEMFRTLKIGGNIWIEVPFLQFEHGFPMDFTRWTVNGLCTLMEDFFPVSFGISELAESYAGKYISYMSSDANIPPPKELILAAESYVREREVLWKRPRFYSGCFFWGRKELPIASQKLEYLKYVQEKYLSEQKLKLDYLVDKHKSFS